MTPTRFGAILALICAVAAWQLSTIGESAIQMSVGASAVPRIVVAALALLTILYTLSAWRGHQVDESHEEDQSALPGSTQRLVSLLAGGLAFMVGLPWLGFILPATACGMCVARAFDAPFNPKSALICAAIAACFWYLFSQVLGVGLGPATPWGALAPA
jgi:Tripartite tricarboxylate transporter TctB family